MRVEPSGQSDAGVESLPTVFCITWDAEFQASFDELDVGSFAESVVNDRFIFIDCDRTCGVNEVTSGF